jgi:hypothetical protein
MLTMNVIGKPYAGKLHVRFEEGVGKVFSFPLYSTGHFYILLLYLSLKIGFAELRYG